MKRRKYLNSRTGQTLDRKTGRFKAKPSAKKVPQVLGSNSTLRDRLRSYLNPDRIAKKLANQAHRGEWGPLQIAADVLNDGPAPESNQRSLNYSRLSLHHKGALLGLIKMSQGEPLNEREEELLKRLEIPYKPPVEAEPAKEAEVEPAPKVEPVPAAIEAVNQDEPPNKAIARPGDPDYEGQVQLSNEEIFDSVRPERPWNRNFWRN